MSTNDAPQTKPCSECGQPAPAGPFTVAAAYHPAWMDKYRCPSCECIPAHNIAASMAEAFEITARLNAPLLRARPELRAWLGAATADGAALMEGQGSDAADLRRVAAHIRTGETAV